MTDTATLLAQPSGTVDGMVAHHARVTPERAALILYVGAEAEPQVVSYATLNRLADRVAVSLQRDGVAPGEVIALCAPLSVEFVALMLGAFRAGVVAAPLASWLDPEAFASVQSDAKARILFIDQTLAQDLKVSPPTRRVVVQGSGSDGLAAWLAVDGTEPEPVPAGPDSITMLLYSSGTTGVPKGVVWRRAAPWVLKSSLDVGDGVMMVSTPSYAATTSAALLPPLTTGGTAVVMTKFDASRFLELAERHRATHAILVPVQYRRILAEPRFDAFDLTSFKRKFSTSAPMAPGLKAEIVRRWPGAFREAYGMSEGSCSCWLDADLHPDKLHTVGLPAPGCEVRILDEAGRPAPTGHIGEIAGRSRMMMAGYHGRPEATAAVEWFDEDGVRFVRTGDLGYLEPDGFLVLVGRSRDMIITGGLNIHAIDLEAVLERHPQVEEAAVVAAPSEQWGETPVAYVVARPGAGLDPESLRLWVNERVGKMQRLSRVRLVEALPRSPIGKVLKRELREAAKTTV